MNFIFLKGYKRIENFVEIEWIESESLKKDSFFKSTVLKNIYKKDIEINDSIVITMFFMLILPLYRTVSKKIIIKTFNNVNIDIFHQICFYHDINNMILDESSIENKSVYVSEEKLIKPAIFYGGGRILFLQQLW